MFIFGARNFLPDKLLLPVLCVLLTLLSIDIGFKSGP